MAFPTAVNDHITNADELIADLGPLVGNAIISEGNKNGPFKNGVDLATRVGLSQKLVSELEAKDLIIVAPISKAVVDDRPDNASRVEKDIGQLGVGDNLAQTGVADTQ